MARSERDPEGAFDGVDFAAGEPELPADEELPEPRITRSRLLPRVLALAAAALVGAVLATHIATGGDHPAASPPSPLASSPSFVERPVPPAPLLAGTGQLLADVPQSDPRWCPGAGDGSPLCTSAPRVPAPALAAVRSRFPGSRVLSAFDEQLRDVGFGPGGLWYREVRAQQDARTIVVVVHRRRVADLAGISEDIDPSGSTLIVTRLVRGFTVQIRLHGPAGRPASRARAHALFAFAGDPRLRASG